MYGEIFSKLKHAEQTNNKTLKAECNIKLKKMSGRNKVSMEEVQKIRLRLEDY